jgi:hypothetical protein
MTSVFGSGLPGRRGDWRLRIGKLMRILRNGQLKRLPLQVLQCEADLVLAGSSRFHQRWPAWSAKPLCRRLCPESANLFNKVFVGPRWTRCLTTETVLSRLVKLARCVWAHAATTTFAVIPEPPHFW